MANKKKKKFFLYVSMTFAIKSYEILLLNNGVEIFFLSILIIFTLSYHTQYRRGI